MKSKRDGKNKREADDGDQEEAPRQPTLPARLHRLKQTDRYFYTSVGIWIVVHRTTR